MIYLVFSFDDGLADFKENALPILEKFSLTATLNIISGFTDKTVPTSYNCLTVEDVRTLFSKGYEIANHTNSHMKYGSYDELLTCNQKINEWCMSDRVLGIAMPKYAKPSKSALRYIKKFKSPYVTYEVTRFPLFCNFLCRLRYKLKRNKEGSKVFEYSYINQIKMYKKGSKKFYRFEVGKKIDPHILFDSLKSIKNNYCLTLCFHSIDWDTENVVYPKGAWTPQQFEEFCDLVKKDKNISVISQREACEKGQFNK